MSALTPAAELRPQGCRRRACLLGDVSTSFRAAPGPPLTLRPPSSRPPLESPLPTRALRPCQRRPRSARPRRAIRLRRLRVLDLRRHVVSAMDGRLPRCPASTGWHTGAGDPQRGATAWSPPACQPGHAAYPMQQETADPGQHAASIGLLEVMDSPFFSCSTNVLAFHHWMIFPLLTTVERRC